MERVGIEAVDHVPHPAGVNTVRRPVSDALGATDCTVVYYELEPGDAFSGGLHRHGDQEELFYVLEGTATFDVRESADDEERTVTVEPGEAIRFERGEFQHGYNDTDERVVALAVAAPKSRHDWEQIEWLAQCRDCDEEVVYAIRRDDDGNIVATCPQCGKELSTG